MHSARVTQCKNMFSAYRCKLDPVLAKKLPKLSAYLGTQKQGVKKLKSSSNGRMKGYRLNSLEMENKQLRKELDKYKQENEKLRAQLKNSEISTHYEEEIQKLKSEIQKLKLENGKKTEIELPSPHSIKNKGSSNTLSINKNLNRQLLVKPVAILETFFIKLSCSLKQVGVSNESFVDKLDLSVTVENLRESIESLGIRIASNELEAVFDILQKDGKVDSNEILENISKFGDDFISDVSSDISSPRTKLSVSMDDFSLSYEGLQESIDFFAMILRNSSKEEFDVKLRNLPDPVKHGDIHKLFLEEPHRIEEGVERNKLTSFLMNGSETQLKSFIISKIKQEFFWYEDQINGKDVQELYQILEKYKTEILKLCRAIDKDNKARLSWQHFFPIVCKMKELKHIQTFELKCKCYSFEKSLHSVPYEDIFNVK